MHAFLYSILMKTNVSTWVSKKDPIFFTVLEAFSPDNLMERFDAVRELQAGLTKSGHTDAKRASQIVSAVQSHFTKRNWPQGKVPKIGELLHISR